MPPAVCSAALSDRPTGLCSYRVRGVDGSCAEHLTVESYTAIYAANSHIFIIIIIIIISFPSPTLS